MADRKNEIEERYSGRIGIIDQLRFSDYQKAKLRAYAEANRAVDLLKLSLETIGPDVFGFDEAEKRSEYDLMMAEFLPKIRNYLYHSKNTLVDHSGTWSKESKRGLVRASDGAIDLGSYVCLPEDTRSLNAEL